jgi:O-antigen ligase
MPTSTTRTQFDARVPPGARRALLVRIAGGVLACLLAVLAVINPMLGLGVTITVLVAVGFTQSATFGICAFVAVTYLEVLTQYAGSTALSPVKVCGGALIAIALLDLVTRTRHGVQRPAPAWARHPIIVAAAVGFVAVGMASASWAVNVAQVRVLSERIVTEVLVFVAIGVFLLRRDQLRAVAGTALGAGAVATLFGMVTGAEAFGRMIGTFSDPNEYASAMVASIGLGFGALAAARTPWGRRACYAAMALCAYGILGSQSRGGLIALVVVGATIVLSSRGRERVRMMGATFVLIAVAVSVMVLTPTGQQSLARITDGDSSGRSDLWRIARAQFRDYPLRGVGLGNFPAVSIRYVDGNTEHTELFVNGAPRTTHNSYLEIAAELGLLGLVTFGTFAGGSLLLAMRGLRAARRLGDPATIGLGRGIVAATLGFLSSCAFLSNHYSELLWALFATCVAFAAHVRRQLQLARALEAARDVVENLPIEELGVQLDGELASAALQELPTSVVDGYEYATTDRS